MDILIHETIENLDFAIRMIYKGTLNGKLRLCGTNFSEKQLAESTKDDRRCSFRRRTKRRSNSWFLSRNRLSEVSNIFKSVFIRNLYDWMCLECKLDG